MKVLMSTVTLRLVVSQVTVLASAGTDDNVPVGDGIDPPKPLAGYDNCMDAVCKSALQV